MLREKSPIRSLSAFLRYLATRSPDEAERLPALHAISEELGVSVARLREQLELARGLGLVEVRPRKGTRRLSYSFLPAVRQSLGYALLLDQQYFQAFSDLRQHIEAAYWHEAVVKLTDEDHRKLNDLVRAAWEKLRGTPIQIPHEEHRALHLLVYSRLANPFVLGLLEAYWEAYEAVGLNVYTDYTYLEEVWQYHTRMVEAICNGNYDEGYQALVQHTDLLYQRPDSNA